MVARRRSPISSSWAPRCWRSAGIVISFLIAAFRYGPLAGGDMVFRVATTAVVDLLRTSPRRVWALARLAIQESLRRNVLVALGVFVVVLLFAGWFLDNTSQRPQHAVSDVRAHATTYLAWALAVFLSAFSLPTDFKKRTIYTVVTKPVRPGEIVLGRILGFTLIGTVMLAIMGADQLRLCLCACSIIPTKSKSPAANGRRRRRARDHRPHHARAWASPPGDRSPTARARPTQERPLARRTAHRRRRGQ